MHDDDIDCLFVSEKLMSSLIWVKVSLCCGFCVDLVFVNICGLAFEVGK